MSVLTRKQFLDYIQQKKIEFEPALDQFQIQPNSIDLRVGWSFYVPKTWEYNEKGRVALNINYLDRTVKKEGYKIIRLKEGQYFEILPGEFIISSALEKIRLNSGDIMAVLLPRSSTTRRGLFVEGGIIDARYNGYLVLPVINNTRDQIIKIYPGERICQLIFHKLEDDLTEEEAYIHGIAQAKYLSSAPYGLEARSDSEQEIEFIRKGNIKDLKNRYKF